MAAITLIALLVFLFRNAGPLREWSDAWRARRRRLDLPTSIAGLALEPESLPDDIVAGARQLWSDGDHRAALSVLYRGAIIELLTRGMVLPESATEGDVIRRASTRLGDDAQAGLMLVVRAWRNNESSSSRGISIASAISTRLGIAPSLWAKSRLTLRIVVRRSLRWTGRRMVLD